MPDIVSFNTHAAAANARLECAVTSYAITKLADQDVQPLRRQSDQLPGNLGNSVLKHSDEQTLTALFAVKEAISHFETAPANYDKWGVVFSSRYLGRAAFANSLSKFAIDGPWNVSVQVVPNRSLHSPASMVGLALGCHGPCVGVGGGLDGETDAWFTAASLLDQHSLDGMWLMFSGWEPDEHVDLEGTPTNKTLCTTLAIALQSGPNVKGRARLSIGLDPTAPTTVAIPAPSTAISLFQKFVAAGNPDQPLTAMLGGGLCAKMEWAAASETTLPLTAAANVQRKAA